MGSTNERKIGYYAVLVCLLLSVISGQFLNSEWVPVILCIGVLILLLCIAGMNGKHIVEKENGFQHRICHYNQHNSVLLWKENEIIDGIVMFQGWLFIAKMLYLICILMLVVVVTKIVNEKLFVNE